MEHAEFTILDWAVLAGYLAGITAFGLWIARRVRTTGGYFLGDRKLPWWVMMGQAFGTGTHAENPVAQAGASYGAGFATIWYQWKNMLITPFYWLMAPWYRRTGRTTIGEIVEDRYGHRAALVYTLFALMYFVFNQGAMLKGAGKVISVATGGDVISANGVVAAMAATFILYSFFGGLVATAYTDFVQGFLIIVLSFMLIPGGLAAVGGFSGMREKLPANFFELYSEVSGVGLFMIAMLTLNGLVGITAQPHILSMNATGRTERAGRVGQTYGNMVKRFCTIGWALTGLIVAAMVVGVDEALPDKEHAFGYACLHLLGPGFLGLLVACVLAANMSTCSNFMVNSGALFTRNLYHKNLRPGATDRELLLVGRISGFGFTMLGVLFALTVGQVLDAFLFNETIPAFLGIMVMGGILWRRANRYGALAGVGASIGVYYALNYHDTGELRLIYTWLPEPFGWAMLAGAAAFVGVSVLTPREAGERVERFFDKLARSSDGEAPLAGQPRPLAADRGQDLLLVDVGGWFAARRWTGFFRRYREDLIGFALAWLSVGALILLAWGLMQLGATADAAEPASEQADAVRIADTMLLYQRKSGGWPKNIDMARVLTDDEKARIARDKDKNDCTIDNGATYRQLAHLARVFDATRAERFKEGFCRGLDALLAAQYANGGWPQYFPKPTGYHRHITFNDSAMIGVMRLLRDVGAGARPYGFVEEARRSRCAAAVARGIECILACQIVVKGARAAWCAQHDAVTLAPAPARSYEKASLSGGESVGIVRFLMEIEKPPQRVVESIEAAVAWFKKVKLSGIKVVRRADPSLPKGYDKVVVEDAAAPPLWARFYEIGTDRPIFCGRDGIIKYRMAEIEHERRVGYDWYTDGAKDLLEKDYPAWRKRRS